MSNTSKDPLEEYLQGDSANLATALTDRSYRTRYQQERKAANRCVPHAEKDNTPVRINFELSTLGDAVLRLALTDLLYRKGSDKISRTRAAYESDKTLVTVIACHYGLLGRIKASEEVLGKSRGYAYDDSLEQGRNPQKYIATAMEAVLGAYYLDKGRRMSSIRPVVCKWMDYVDELSAGSEGPDLADAE